MRVFLTVSATLLAGPAESIGIAAEEIDEGSWYARVRALEGEVRITNPRGDEAIEASPNTPLEAGDRVETGADGRLEIQFRDGSLVWGDRDTRFDLRSLGSPDSDPPGVARLRFWEGALFLQVPSVADPGSRFQIDTPVVSVNLPAEAEVRVESGLAGDFRISAYAGEAEVAGERTSVRVPAGYRVVTDATGEPLPPEPFNTARLDAFGEWVVERQEIFLAEAPGEPGAVPPAEELPPEIAPYLGEMNHYGGWQQVPVYGWVWRPYSLAVDWRPYTLGYWGYYPTGWVWVSYEPWGWYPYHYGRWHWVVGTGWCWIPGRVWSGAWVSWAISFSYIGWCPLNYYNEAAFVGLHFSTYDARGWRFVPYSRFHSRAWHRHAVPPSEVQARERVLRSLGHPGFRPRDLTSPGLGVRLTREAKVAGTILPGAASPSRMRAFRSTDPRETPAGVGRRLPHRQRFTPAPGVSSRRGELPDRTPDRPAAALASPSPRRAPVGARVPSTPAAGRGATSAPSAAAPSVRPGPARPRMPAILDRIRRPRPAPVHPSGPGASSAAGTEKPRPGASSPPGRKAPDSRVQGRSSGPAPRHPATPGRGAPAGSGSGGKKESKPGGKSGKN
ncbi:MAG: FecR domain-containing protein [Acidobacteria bacterium]|nr:FecR domain-containing protein [Acidobacteriota bacterium]